MWIFTEQGYFSVVQDRSDTGRLLVRTRLRGDLERLRAKEPRLGPTREDAGTDYRFRADIPREAFAELLARLAMELAYGNFKGRVEEVDGPGRETLYMKVWTTMYAAQESERQDEQRQRAMPGR